MASPTRGLCPLDPRRRAAAVVRAARRGVFCTVWRDVDLAARSQRMPDWEQIKWSLGAYWPRRAQQASGVTGPGQSPGLNLTQNCMVTPALTTSASLYTPHQITRIRKNVGIINVVRPRGKLVQIRGAQPHARRQREAETAGKPKPVFVRQPRTARRIAIRALIVEQPALQHQLRHYRRPPVHPDRLHPRAVEPDRRRFDVRRRLHVDLRK